MNREKLTDISKYSWSVISVMCFIVFNEKINIKYRVFLVKREMAWFLKCYLEKFVDYESKCKDIG